MRHQYKISALVSRTTFRGETVSAVSGLGKCLFPILYSIKVKSKPFYMIKINGFGSALVKLTVRRGMIQYDLFTCWKFGLA